MRVFVLGLARVGGSCSHWVPSRPPAELARVSQVRAVHSRSHIAGPQGQLGNEPRVSSINGCQYGPARPSHVSLEAFNRESGVIAGLFQVPCYSKRHSTPFFFIHSDTSCMYFRIRSYMELAHQQVYKAERMDLHVDLSSFNDSFCLLKLYLRKVK